jgi:hypothetical protein
VRETQHLPFLLINNKLTKTTTVPLNKQQEEAEKMVALVLRNLAI